jgi:hypothetical protein
MGYVDLSVTLQQLCLSRRFFRGLVVFAHAARGDPALAAIRECAHIPTSAPGPNGGAARQVKAKHQKGRRDMGKIVAIALLSTLFLGTTAFAADAVDGTWNLNAAKSKFSGPAPKSVTRVYSNGADGAALDQKMVGPDGKEMSMHVALAFDGKPHPITGNPDADASSAKAINTRTSDFTLTKGGKTTGTVHRVVSADGKTLTVHNKGTHADGTSYDDTLIFDKQ